MRQVGHKPDHAKKEGANTMETIDIFGFQLDFVKDLLREHINSKDSDRDTRLMANDILEQINKQYPDEVQF